MVPEAKPAPEILPPGQPAPKGRSRSKFVTQALISRLNEADPKSPDGKKKVDVLVDQLIAKAIGGTRMVRKKTKILEADGSYKRDARGRLVYDVSLVEVDVEPELEAMKYIYDRIEGRPTQSLALDDGGDDSEMVLITRNMTPAQAAEAYRDGLKVITGGRSD